MPSARDPTERSVSEVERFSHTHGDMADRGGDGNVLSVPVAIRRGGSETCLDQDLDWLGREGRDIIRSRPALEGLQQKILKVTEQLKIEQTLRDDNVAEYLKLINSADKQQSSRIRAVFEKKNQKSAQSISQLQRKLEQYHRRTRDTTHTHTHTHAESDSNGAKHSTKESKEASKDSLRETGGSTSGSGSGRHPTLDKVKTIGPGVSLSPPFFVSKSREFANLIRNKFGSADNIAQLKVSMETGEGGAFQPEGGARVLSGSATLTPKPKYQSDDEESEIGTSVSAESTGQGGGGSGSGVQGGEGGVLGGDGGVQGEPPPPPGRISEALEEIREVRETQVQLADDLEALRAQFKQDYGLITHTLQEERYRYERLEDQLNDLTELHQNETAILKQELASIEEKVAYQAYERARDIQEALEACQTRVSKLELQQQQQQIVQLESTDAKVLLGKCINIMLAIVTVILVCVSTAAKFATPLLRSRVHLLASCLGVGLLVLVWRNWHTLTLAVERVLTS